MDQEEKITKEIFSSRVTSVMESKKMTQAQLAEMIGVAQSAISYWKKGQRLAGGDELRKLAKALEVSSDYLLGLDEFASRDYPDPPPSHEIKESAPKNWGGPYWGTSDEAPVVQAVCAGNARAWEDAGNGAPRIKVNCKDPNVYVVEVWGDSMQPVYHQGDLLVIAPNLQVNTNDLVVFKTEEDEPFFKKYLGQRKGVHRFASLNPNYPVMELKDGIIKIHPVHSVIRPLKGKIF